jgi:hypothetical protein
MESLFPNCSIKILLISIEYGLFNRGREPMKPSYYPTTCGSYTSMINRCYNKKHPHYKDYGGRGIKVCIRWRKSFFNFLEDMGRKPEGLTLERIDNNKGYYKENCKWATWEEQANNRRNNKYITYNGKTQTMAQWAKEYNIPRNTFYNRIKAGWSIERAILKSNSAIEIVLLKPVIKINKTDLRTQKFMEIIRNKKK